MEIAYEIFADVFIQAQMLGYAAPGNPQLDLIGFDGFAKVRQVTVLFEVERSTAC